MEKNPMSTIKVPKELHRQAKAIAALQGRPVQEVYTELLRDYLEKAQPKAPQPLPQ